MSLVSSPAINAQPIPWPDVASQKTLEALRFESFNITATEPITTYGARLGRYLTPNLYWGGAGYGGLLGIRGGWFVGGLILGWTAPINEIFFFDLEGFFGGGGGHAAPQGGGMLVKLDGGLGYRFSPAIEAMLSAGYNYYVNGDIRSPYLGFEMRSIFYELKN